MHLRSLTAVRRMPRLFALLAGLVFGLAVDARALPLVVTTASLDAGTAGTPYADTLAADLGTLPYTWTLAEGTLPTGLSLAGVSGEIAGTPTVAGTAGFVVLATDALGDTASRALAITIAPGALTTLAFTVQPSDALPGATITPAVQVLATDAFANPVPGVPVSLALLGTGVLSGGGAQNTDANGLAVFAALSVSLSGSKQLEASSGLIGPVASAPFVVVGVPAAVTNLAVARTTSGNDGDGTIKLAVTFTPSTFTSSVEVYRAPYGGYPRYDDAGGLTPPTPSYPPGSPWVLTAVTASGQTDEPATRDAYSYVVFLKNAFGQVSAVSNKTAPTPGYALGDVSNGLVAGSGDNLVNDLDVSLLGAHYGISGTAITTAGVSYLDVGPTVDFGMASRPFTDGRIDFEDLIVFATNYGEVTAPAGLIAGADAAARAAQGRETFVLDAPRTVQAGAMFDVRVQAETFGRIQGLSLALAWDPAVAEPVAMASEGWLEDQRGVLWPSEPGAFDGALLGARAQGLMGRGTIARFTFRATRSGEPLVRIASLVARDAANRTLGAEQLAFAGERVVPMATALLAPSPNPAPGASRLSFALAHAGTVDLTLYSVDGRRVRTLAQGVFEAGTHGFTWDGLDDAQHRVAPGVYFARLVADGRTLSKMLVQLR